MAQHEEIIVWLDRRWKEAIEHHLKDETLQEHLENVLDELCNQLPEREYMYLKDRSDAGNTCWPSIRRIAEDLKLSRRTVQRALTDLERHGFLERTHRCRPNGSLTSNLYRVK